MVRAITETDFNQEPALAKIMNSRLLRAATELQNFHLIQLNDVRAPINELRIEISYNAKYKIRYRILQSISPRIDHFVAERCSRLGYILWRSSVSALNIA